MKIRNNKNKVSVLAFAVQSAMLTMFAMPLATISLVSYAADAADDEALKLKRPTNTIQLGGMNVSSDSAKFGEYNGLDHSDLYGIANIDVRGGNAYGEGGGVMRWQIKGTDLGTSSRELAAKVSSQGQWSLGVGYDELTHNLTDDYQTPYLGNMGGNQFTLPAGFGTITNTNSMTAPQKATFHTVDVSSKRKNTSFTAGYNINPQWDVTLDVNHLNQTGAKLMAFASALNGALVGQRISILPAPTDYTTDTVNLAVNWAGDKSHVNVAYFGSFFQNEYNRVNFATFDLGGANATQTMSTAPDNQFHQLNLMGGYVFSPQTKLAGGLSYGRNTQNDSFTYDAFMMNAASPKSSLNGVVINTHGDLKLSNSSIKNLTLSAGVKYDERDNRTESDIYSFKAIGTLGPGTGNGIYPNTPLSNKKTQWELAGDYRISSTQHVRLAYNRENISRWCNQYAVNAAYPAGTNCVVATDSADDMLSANYKLNASENFHLNTGYSYSDRNTDSDSNAIAAFNSIRGNVGILSNSGGIKGINAGDYLGFYPYFNASRKQQTLKAGAEWQAHEKLSLGFNGRYTDDDYDSQYGVQRGNTWSLNLDSTFNYNTNGSISAYISKEHRERDMTNVQRGIGQPLSAATATAIAIPSGATWSNQLSEDDITFGLSAKHGGLMKRKLELSGDLTYSLGETGYGTKLNYNTTTTSPGLLTCSALSINTCGQLPDIRNKLLQLKLAADYKVSKSGTVAVGYQYQRLTSSDYFYSPYQNGTTPTTVLPTNQETGSYSVNLVTATYTYTF